MASKEATLTTELVKSLARAGVTDPWKIPDPPRSEARVNKTTGQEYRTARGGPNPCDVIGVLPGGRAVHIEAKQMPLARTGQVPAFNYKRLAPHQHLHLHEVADNGGCAVVALFVWRTQARDQKWVKRLYWLPYRPLLEEWTLHGDSIPGSVMSAKTPVPVQTKGDRGAFDGWDLRAEIAAASGIEPPAPLQRRQLTLADVRLVQRQGEL